MSQHTFEYGQYAILCGWDRPLQGYFLVIEDKDQDDPIYSNLDEPNPHPNVFDPFEAVLKRFGIVLPDDMLSALYMDKIKNIGNSVTNWGDIEALHNSTTQQSQSKMISIHKLDIDRGLAKQLDEYRELLETIEKHTGYFSTEQGQFSAMHAATLDDYLSHLYALKCEKSPNDNVKYTDLRPKPPFIKSNE
ncbi:hypothetical protein [Vibrio maritimus]|uniref:hypothetical protein n=1 Tax=Vibrio maritimus TaxID=990268 RepID=UPI001F43FF25|nr:hypothetical protein [Vibrio maritimus]